MIKVAKILLIRKDGAFLLQQRDNKPGIANPGLISAFGGSLEAGETPLAAAVREINEETNLNLKPSDLHFYKQYRKTEESTAKTQLSTTFLLKISMIQTYKSLKAKGRFF